MTKAPLIIVWILVSRCATLGATPIVLGCLELVVASVPNGRSQYRNDRSDLLCPDSNNSAVQGIGATERIGGWTPSISDVKA